MVNRYLEMIDFYQQKKENEAYLKSFQEL